jgi:hypothetical protein
MPLCRAIKRDGGRCTARVARGVQWCFNHDPAHAEERRRNASRAGRSVSGRELRAIKARLDDLAKDVVTGEVQPGRAAVAGQLLNTLLRAIELERKVRETDELAADIQELRRELA